jgi:antitoxin component YwqK of YwqJK toxin-antitoxin module
MTNRIKIISTLCCYLLITGCSSAFYEKGLVYQNNLKEHYKQNRNSDKTRFSHVTLYGLRFSGLSIETFEDGSVKTKREYKHGKPTGAFISYFPNGKVSLELKVSPYEEFMLYDSTGSKKIHRIDYRSGKSEESLFYDNGNIQEFYADKYNGLYSRHYKWDQNGNLTELYVADSVYIRMDAITGNILEKGEKDEFRNKQGKYIVFAPDANPSTISNYKHNQLDGFFESFHHNGKTAANGWYDYGIRAKDWKLYGENGLVLQEFSYQGGELHGYFAEYHENGQKKIEGSYHDGAKIGKWIIYSSNGKILEEFNF